MRDVKLVRLSDDGTHLVLTHEGTGEDFALRVDDRLRGAVVSDRARQGSLPRERQSRLRPKEIQARLRAGESSESIAAAAGVPLERVLRYAGPVLAEREYMAEQGRRCALRRTGREGPGQILEEAVNKRLEELGALSTAHWDAWRNPEGRWVVAVNFSLNGTEIQATFHYDPVGRVVTTADDKARALVGEGTYPGLSPEPAPEESSEQASDGRHRDGTHYLRLAPVPSPQQDDLDDDTSRPASVQDPETEETVDLSHTLRQTRQAPPEQRWASDRAASSPWPANATSAVDEPGQASAAQASVDARTDEDDAKTAARRRSADARRRRVRSSGRRGNVPSWDDILFGGGRGRNDA
ncbi:septation protein SepH [Thermasporomyces composti]|jgi:hypothetical protein|uniref:DUF3071 family protein n=1 Tax=Thermasporomyces composti TaxID=696763 RepID=A0A3D9VBR0_THECX|nr:septation protein SepH [Thermasporomyces composti]REF38143.1 DUF3071 family protein [Thermasporomyces composti]